MQKHHHLHQSRVAKEEALPIRMILFRELGFCSRSRAASPHSTRACKDTNKNPLTKKRKHANNNKFTRSEVESAHWRPLLSAISEDRVSNFYGQSRETKYEKRPSNKDRSKATTFNHDHNDKCREDLIPVAMQAFSPTPFTF